MDPGWAPVFRPALRKEKQCQEKHAPDAIRGGYRFSVRHCVSQVRQFAADPDPPPHPVAPLGAQVAPAVARDEQAAAEMRGCRLLRFAGGRASFVGPDRLAMSGKVDTTFPSDIASTRIGRS
jgi:hypothetical protein